MLPGYCTRLLASLFALALLAALSAPLPPLTDAPATATRCPEAPCHGA